MCFTHVCWRTRNGSVLEIWEESHQSPQQKHQSDSFSNMILICHNESMMWRLNHACDSRQPHEHACIPTLTPSSSANWKSRLCVSMAIRVFSLCENWRRVMTAASLCWHCQAIAFRTILNHTDYLQSYWRGCVDWQWFGQVNVPRVHSFYHGLLRLHIEPIELIFRNISPTAEGWVSQKCGESASQAFFCCCWG